MGGLMGELNVSDLDDLSLVHDDDEVRVHDGGEAVGDYERRFVLCHFPQRVQNLFLREGVHRTRHLHHNTTGTRTSACGVWHDRLPWQHAPYLITNEHGRVPEDRPGDGDPLPLAPRQPCPPLAHSGVIAVGHGHDALVDAGLLGGSDHLHH